MSDNVDLRKTDGSVEPDLKASVQGNRIFMNAGRLPVEPGDMILRKLSTGILETYRVVDPGFNEAIMDFPAHYQMKVIRAENVAVSGDEISEERKQALYRQWEEIGVDIIKQDLGNGGFRYVGGPPATRRLAMQWVRLKETERERDRMNVHVSGPNARVNIHSTDQSANIAIARDLFASIREAMGQGIEGNAERERIEKLLAEVEAAKDKSGFLSAYQKLIASAADHITVLGPFLPALTQLLQGLSS